ncbi:hypothetical protein BJP34_14485 [Moorena producens PAL-8-15-08-1]|uniref:Uncharacterized protein n=1 Tax=Moorena producens PAL-8-15-08-1 TaxID=1458985 RepID=A0A1D8TS73_9CYAN|nr:hypothetical protein BJP34_14485 [Moorena producens PAL-8-15-08-1]
MQRRPAGVSPTRALHQDGSREKGTKILTIPTRIGKEIFINTVINIYNYFMKFLHSKFLRALINWKISWIKLLMSNSGDNHN